VVALDPKTGDVIVLASTPGFDPNNFVRGLTVAEYSALNNDIDKPLLNRALRGAYPPGSTVKPLDALGRAEIRRHDAHADGVLQRAYFTLPGSSHQVSRRQEAWQSLDMRRAIAGPATCISSGSRID
jgi:penicillin-binding protein 2